MKLKTGTTLQGGKYLLNQALGGEDFGITYLATQTYLNQTVVIKTLDPSLQVTHSFPQLHQRFVEETRLLARSQHPSIVRILDFFQEENLPFLVMEHVPGKTLAETIKSKGAMSEAEAIHYIQQIGSALTVVHKNGLIHRNLKPETIIRRHGTNLAVLVGFGIAQDLAPSVSPPQALDLKEFVPPDQSWAENHRFATDLHALAAILYHLLTARLPIAPLPLDSEPWNPALKQAILRGMSQDETARPQTIADWLRLLPRESIPLTAANGTKLHLPGQSASQNGHSVAASQSPLTKTAIDNQATLPVVPAAPLSPVKTVPLPSGIKRTTPTPSRAKLERHLPKILGVTTAAAASIGIGFGLVLRFSAARAPGASLFHPEQAFPSKDWKGTLIPQGNLSDVPVEKPGTAPEAYTNNLTIPQAKTPLPESLEYKSAPSADDYLTPPPLSEPPRQVTPQPKTPTAEVVPTPVVPDSVTVPPVANPLPVKPSVLPADPEPSATPEPPPVNPSASDSREIPSISPKEAPKEAKP